MRYIEAPPVDHEFVPIREYQASAPASFALEESPVLWSKASGTFSGLVSGEGSLWVASNGVHIWLPHQTRGIVLGYTEVVLNALRTGDGMGYVYIQLDCHSDDGTDVKSLEFHSIQAPQIHGAILLGCEAQHFDSSSSSSSGCIEEFEVDPDTADITPSSILELQGGQADDLDSVIPSHPTMEESTHASASVSVPTLLTRKRRRSS